MPRWIAVASGLVLACTTAPSDGGGTDDATGSTTVATTTSAVDDTATPMPGEPSPVCVAYLQCIAAQYPDLVAAADNAYGPDAACWRDPSNFDDCEATCQLGLDGMCTDVPLTTGEPPAMADCSLAGLAPGVESPVVSGTDAGMLPPPIGAVFEAHCGCHLVDDEAQLVEGTPPYLGTLDLRTYEDVQAPFRGQPTWREIERRSITQLNMPPTYHCGLVDFGALPTVDYETLADWIAAGAPDGADWP